MNRFPITKLGYEKLKNEINDLKFIERPSVLEAIKIAREYGDLSENAEYASAKEKQAFIEGKIADLENKLNRAEIIDTSTIKSDLVTFGANVELLDCDTDEKLNYMIVGDYEADTSNGFIAISAPLSRSLIGKGIGQEISLTTPRGLKTYEILSIEYK